MSRLFSMVAVAVTLSLLLVGCGGSSGSTVALTSSPGELTIDPPPRNLSVEQVVAQIEDEPAPDGVDDELFSRLKEQLVRDIRATSSGKVTAAPPMGDYNQVTDLKLYGDTADGKKLRWTYLNRGDGNLDGLVSINDLTPIGLYFHHSQEEGGWASASRADFNNDGLVSINDITPIGQNYLSYCVGYNIYSSAYSDGPWDPIGSVPLPDAPATGRLVITNDLPVTGAIYFQVRPFDDNGVEGIASLVSMPTVMPEHVQIGDDIFEVTEVIGPLGGIISGVIGGTGPMFSMEFPPGAVEDEHAFRIGSNDGSYIPSMGDLKSPIVAVDTDGVRSFKKPVKIQVSYDRKDYGKAIVPYIVDDEGKLHLIDLVEIQNFVAEFETYQLLPHVLWVVQEINIADIYGFLRTSAFVPARDGLQVVNTGSMWHPGGECFGMTGFSNWYFNTQMSSEGDLFPRFMYEVPIYGGRTGQRIICTRAFTSIAKEWNNYWDTFVSPQGGLSDGQRFASVCNGIENSGHPVLVDLRHENGAGGAHSVLAYKYSASELWVYDPNAPGMERIITYNSGTGDFTPYSGYDSIRYSGSGSLWLDEPYQNILDDAEHQFASNGYASITITSHGTGQSVPTGMVTVSGRIESTVELVDELMVSAGSTFLDLPIPPDGTFNIQVNLVSGTNPFFFSTYATRLDGTEVFIPHDMGGGAFTLTGT